MCAGALVNITATYTSISITSARTFVLKAIDAFRNSGSRTNNFLLLLLYLSIHFT